MSDIELQAYRGTDSVFLAWWHDTAIDGCLGYAVLRRVDGQDATPLNAYVGFSTQHAVQSNAAAQPSTSWPYQRFTWSDFEVPAHGKVEYSVIAITGETSQPTQSDIQSAWFEPATPQPEKYKPFFNVGIVGARWFAKCAEAYPEQFEALRAALAPRHSKTHSNDGDDTNNNAADPDVATQALETVLQLPLPADAIPAAAHTRPTPTIGSELGGELAKQMHALLDEVLKTGDMHLYLVLFELSDSDLIARLAKLGPRCHLVLANGTHEKGTDENASAAAALTGKVDLSRRILKPSGVYAHNKFAVFVTGGAIEKNGKAQKVWTGSTNWTPHGLYTQVNNGLLVDDATIAAAYLAEWQRLREADFRTPPPASDGQVNTFKHGTQTTSVFFSPHLPKSIGANSPDLAYARSLIQNAKSGILTLMLDPGWQGSLLQDIREQAEADTSLYIRGVVNTDPTIHAHEGDATAVGFLHGTEAVPSNYDIVLPATQHDTGAPILDYLGRVGIVVVHSKIIVIDPLGDHPVVMTGSHNAGVKAATINDDNLIIIENDRDLAIAYAVNAIAVFNHFWWRHNMAPPAKRKSAKAGDTTIGGPSHLTSPHEWTGLRPDDSWQNKFYANDSSAGEARFWGLEVTERIA
ncbi:phospholipase D-like domain-containing protein [Paraburkholderia bannensis]|uniref:phospholipase D-like domain-containing protein n=1 Tax=Paraburkholderia bannensis TaxID=765414 RepID=UPI002AC33326|nr:phospholipase D-like domain-containing protein [Paraburkholderia bannensis]